MYEYFADTTEFETAIQVLEKVYVKKKNEIFARHQLATRRQRPSETLDEFLRDLHRLSKDCTLKDVTAEEYREELVRDAFINGLSSANIRQRLLETQALTLSQAFDQTRSLDLAQRTLEAFQSLGPVIAAASGCLEDAVKSPYTNQQEIRPVEDSTLASMTTKKRCWFCATSLHLRARCPAKDSDCSSCGKKGHWAKVCQTKGKKQATASISSPTLCAISAAVPYCLNCSATNLKVNGRRVSGLIDSASSESFIDKLHIKPASQSITLAMSSSTASVIGECTVDLYMKDSIYPNTRLGVIENLCGDVILGIDFQKQHSSVTIEYGGPRPELKISNIGNKPVCSLTSAGMSEPLLFANMQGDAKPIATKS
ncbi:uncharacterized protein LOC121876351 [Homarus americanus]|uniref:uncharacterized protein LOC121876351 n=1 Tax=Homarus americanus TaxID=6706 RepID=UPI001C47B199|nr:uncharacterized protein LOC121876351 [Homarus americanus]